MAYTVATAAELEVFQAETTQWTASLRGVLAEIATTGVIRYSWNLLLPLLCAQVKRVVYEYAEREQCPETRRDELEGRLCAALGALPAAPFTTQRLTEVLLEPGKQYAQLEKLAAALEKLVTVTTTIPVTPDPPTPLPLLESLPDVNENPPPVQFRHVVATDVFQGMLEEKTDAAAMHANGVPEVPRDSDLAMHVLRVSDPPAEHEAPPCSSKE